jgi:hypothetical protein
MGLLQRRMVLVTEELLQLRIQLVASRTGHIRLLQQPGLLVSGAAKASGSAELGTIAGYTACGWRSRTSD